MKTIPEPSRTNLNFHPQVALARAVMVVNEDLSALILCSKTWEFHVFHLWPGIDDNRMADSTMADLEIAHLLCNRILVTRRAGTEFRYIAPIHEFSIIDVAECLQDDLASMAQEISQHWNQLRLRDKQPFTCDCDATVCRCLRIRSKRLRCGLALFVRAVLACAASNTLFRAVRSRARNTRCASFGSVTTSAIMNE